MDNRKVAFFVDDDQDFLKLIQEGIQHPHFQIKTLHVNNGYHAIDEIIKIGPDILFIDFYLPRINGSQILPVIQYVQSLSDLPVYFITGFSKDKIIPLINKTSHYSGVLMKDNHLREEILKILEDVDKLAA